MAAVIEINFDCELCDFVSRHRYNFKRHLKRMHGKTELEAEELAKEEERRSLMNTQLLTNKKRVKWSILIMQLLAIKKIMNL